MPEFPDIYEELRSIARTYWRSSRKQNLLQTTELVHEVYLRLKGQGSLDAQDRNHYLALAAHTLRRVLIDHVRSSQRAKRGGQWKRVTLSGEVFRAEPAGIDALELDEALSELARSHPRRAQVVELRFFGGLSVEECASVLGVSERTIKNDWLIARASLLRRLRSGQ